MTLHQLPLIILSGIGLLVLGDLLVHLVYATMALRRFENRPPFFVAPPPANGLVPEPLRIATSHNLELEGGAFFPLQESPVGVVIFCPETDGCHLTAMNYVSALVDAGYVVVSLSFRNQGASDEMAGYHATHWLTEYEVQDVQATIDFVRNQPQFAGLPIGLCGISRGAGAALAAGANRPEIAAVWAQGAFATHPLVFHFSLKWAECVVGRSLARLIPPWHVRVTMEFMLFFSAWKNGCRFVHLESYLPKWKHRRVQFVAGARDTYLPADQTRRLCQASGHLIESSLWLVPKAKHNLERVVDPERYDAQLVHFFDEMVASRVEPVQQTEVVA